MITNLWNYFEQPTPEMFDNLGPSHHGIVEPP